MRNEPIIVTRNQVGQWASFIGGASLLLGIIGLLWQGGFSPAVIVLLLVGTGGIGAWALATPAEFRGFISGRQTRYGTAAVFSTLLLIGIVALAYIVLQRAVLTLDMTRDNRFSISQESKSVLHRVTTPIRITGFYSARAIQQRDKDDQFFRAYEVETNGLISRQYINPDEQPAMVKAFNVTDDAAVYISYLNADGNVDFNTLARVPRGTSQERDMTEAVARLLIAGSIKVYFETSHGELDPMDITQVGIAGINNGVRESGLVTAGISLADVAKNGAQIPNDAAAVIFVRPTTDLSEPEIKIIDTYLQNGGALFLMAEPTFNDDRFLKQDGAFNQFLWQKYGLRGLDAVIVDPASSTKTPLDIASAAISGATPIGARLSQNSTQTVFSVARAVEVTDNPPENTPNGKVIMSSPQSYGETDLRALGETNSYRYDEGKDLKGPLASVVWASNTKTNAKILLIGDGDFVSNSQVMTAGNSVLFTDGLSWLTSFGERINFAPKSFATVPLMFIDGQTLDLLAFITVILIPGLVLVSGLAIWTRRVRQ